MRKMLRPAWLLMILLFVPLASGPALAEVGLYGKVGTLGLEAGVEARLNELIGARFGVGYLPWSDSKTVDAVNYEFDISMLSLGAFLDVHPFGGGFRISGGVIACSHKFDGKATPSATRLYTIGNTQYPGAALGSLEAKTKFNDLAPYLGIGYSSLTKDDAWSFQFDLGVMYWGSPKVELSSTNPLGLPGLQADLDAEASNVEDDLKPYKFYPVLSLGLSYRF